MFSGLQLYCRFQHLLHGSTISEAEANWKVINGWHRQCWTDLASWINQEIVIRLQEQKK